MQAVLSQPLHAGQAYWPHLGEAGGNTCAQHIAAEQAPKLQRGPDEVVTLPVLDSSVARHGALLLQLRPPCVRSLQKHVD